MSTYNAIRYNNPYTNAGSLILLSTQTASASSSISFTSGIDSTYKEYLFLFNNIHPSANAGLGFNVSSDGGSNYGITKTSTFFRTTHNEDDSGTALEYITSRDLAQSTARQEIIMAIGNNADEQGSGYMHLYNPSSTTYVKHFISCSNCCDGYNYTINQYCAGYINSTSAINAIKFSMTSGNIDDGTIQMFGVVS